MSITKEQRQANRAYYATLPLSEWARYNRNGECGLWGSCWEMATNSIIHGHLVRTLKGAGSVDGQAVIAGKPRKYEVKQNGGHFRCFEELMKGESVIIYASHIDLSKTWAEQDAIILDRDTILHHGVKCGAVRVEKQSTNDGIVAAMQTEWIYSKNARFGRFRDKLFTAEPIIAWEDFVHEVLG